MLIADAVLLDQGTQADEQAVPEPVKLHPIGHPDDDLVVVTKDEPPPKVEPGLYQSQCIRMAKGRYRGGQKLYAWFRICDGPCAGLELYRAYNYEKPLGHQTDLYKTLVMLHGKRVGKRTRLDPRVLFMNKVLEIEVRTVVKDYKQNPVPEHQQYSVVDRVVRVLAGGNGL